MAGNACNFTGESTVCSAHCSGVQQRKHYNIPDNKVHEAYMGPTWGRQDPGGSHVGLMILAIWDNATFDVTGGTAWQPAVLPVATKSASWQLSVFSNYLGWVWMFSVQMASNEESVLVGLHVQLLGTIFLPLMHPSDLNQIYDIFNIWLTVLCRILSY